MKFFKFQIQEYMDVHPETEVFVLESENKAREFADFMRNNCSGGTVEYLGEMDSVEAANYVRHLYNIEKDDPTCDSHDYLLDIAQKYKKCYGADVITAEELKMFP